MIIGIQMVAVYAFVGAHPRCSKRAAALHVATDKGLSAGYRAVDCTIRHGLVAAQSTVDGRWELTAQAPDDIPDAAYGALIRFCERRWNEVPKQFRRSGKVFHNPRAVSGDA